MDPLVATAPKVLTLPALPMIKVDPKKCAPIDFMAQMGPYIASAFDVEASHYTHELEELTALRERMRQADRSLQGRDAVFAYWSQIAFLESRFQIDGQHLALDFDWEDSLTGERICQHSLAYEKANIIYNLAALFTCIAAQQDRSGPSQAEALKRTFTFYEKAAGIFLFINDNFLHAPSTDLNRAFVQVCHALCVAQAQEAFLLTVLATKTKGSLVVKLMTYLAQQYDRTLHLMQHDVAAPVVDKRWRLIVQLKAKLFHAFLQHTCAETAEEEEKYGELVTRRAQALALIKEAQSILSTAPAMLAAAHSPSGKLVRQESKKDNNAKLPEFMTPFTTVITELAADFAKKHQMAVKDNDVVYHQTIPGVESLTPTEGKAAPKEVTFADVCKELGPIAGSKDIFKRLVPNRVHAQVSLLSEEKAKIMRAANALQETMDREAQTTMQKYQLPQSVASFASHTSSMSNNKWTATILSSVAEFQLAEKTTEATAMASQCLALGQTIYQRLQACNEAAQKSPKLAETWATANTTLRKTTLDVEEAKKQIASQSDTLDKCRDADTTRVLKSLRGGEKTAEPTLLDSPVDGNTAQFVAELKKSLHDVQLKKEQRAAAFSQLKTAVQSPDTAADTFLSAASEQKAAEVMQQALAPLVALAKQHAQLVTDEVQLYKTMTEALDEQLASQTADAEEERQRWAPIQTTVEQAVSAYRKWDPSAALATFQQLETTSTDLAKAVEEASLQSAVQQMHLSPPSAPSLPPPSSQTYPGQYTYDLSVPPSGNYYANPPSMYPPQPHYYPPQQQPQQQPFYPTYPPHHVPHQQPTYMSPPPQTGGPYLAHGQHPIVAPQQAPYYAPPPQPNAPSAPPKSNGGGSLMD